MFIRAVLLLTLVLLRAGAALPFVIVGGCLRSVGTDRAGVPRPGGKVSGSAFVPKGPGATTYEGPLHRAPDLGGVEEHVLRAFEAERRAVGGDRQQDPRLHLVARALASALKHTRVDQARLVDFLLSYHGIVAPRPRIVQVEASDDGPIALFAAQASREIGPFLREHAHARFGVGSTVGASGKRIVVLLFQDSLVELGPCPRRLPRGSGVMVNARLKADFHAPRLFVVVDDAKPRLLPVQCRGQELTTYLECPAAAKMMQVEVVADNALGPAVLANFPIWCADEPPLAFDLEPPPATALTPQAAERDLLRRVNAYRLTQGVQPVGLDLEVQRVARDYAAAMAKSGVVAHNLPGQGWAPARLQEAGVKVTLVGENLGRGDSAGSIHAGLVNSPGHRYNLLAVEATHVGIGVAVSAATAADLFAAEIFIDRGRHDAAPWRAEVRHRLRAQAPALIWDEAQEVAAQRWADGLAVELDASTLATLVPSTAGGVGRPVVRRVGSLRALVVTDLVRELDGRSRCGVGVAAAPTATLGDNAAFVVVLCAERGDGGARPTPDRRLVDTAGAAL